MSADDGSDLSEGCSLRFEPYQGRADATDWNAAGGEYQPLVSFSVLPDDGTLLFGLLSEDLDACADFMATHEECDSLFFRTVFNDAVEELINVHVCPLTGVIDRADGIASVKRWADRFRAAAEKLESACAAPPPPSNRREESEDE